MSHPESSAINTSAKLAEQLEQSAERQKAQNALALRGYENLIQDQTETIRSLREKCGNYQSALSRSEAQVSKLLRTKNQPCQPSSAAGRSAASVAGERMAYPVTKAAESIESEPRRNELESDSVHTSDLEMDGMGVERLEFKPTFEDYSQSTDYSPLKFDRVTSQRDAEEQFNQLSLVGNTPHYKKEQQFNQSSSLVTRSVVAQPLAEQRSSSADALPMKSPEMRSPFSSLPGTKGSATVSMVTSEAAEAVTCDASPDLVAKLMSQNGRLKKVMRDILKLKGLTLCDYLDKQEYEDVVEQLRQELKQARSTVEHYKIILAQSSDAGSMTRINAELVQKVAMLEKSVMINKVMVQSYSQQYDQLVKDTNDSIHLKSENERQRMDIGKLQAAFQQKLKEMEILQQEFNQACQSEQRLKASLAEQTKQLKKAEDNVLASRYQSETYEKDFSKVEYQNQVLRSQLESLKEERARISRMTTKSFVDSVSYGHTDARTSDIGIDGAHDTNETSPKQPTTEENLVCSRCDRVFQASDASKFEAHREKCKD